MIVKCDDFGCEFENFIYRIFEFPGKKIVALLVKSILLLYIYEHRFLFKRVYIFLISLIYMIYITFPCTISILYFSGMLR